MSFEKDNEERRKREEQKKNLIKWYGAKIQDKVFHVGNPDLLSPYSGNPIYEPVEEPVEELAIEESDGFDYQDGETSEQYSLGIYIEGTEETATDNNTSSEDSNASLSDEEAALANEIYARLMAEAAADEAAKQAEIDRLLQEQEPNPEDYNADTGSYSGAYGKKPLSQSDSDMLASILNQNSSYTKSIEDLIAENQDPNNN